VARAASGSRAPEGVRGSWGRWLERAFESSARRDFFLALLLVTAVIFAYAQVRDFGFVNFDDGEYVYDNPRVAAGITRDGLVWAFTAVHSANWHPLTWLSHMLDCELFGLDAGWHHLTNVVLHGFSTLCLYGALCAMTAAPLRSAFVAALYAVHPLHVESVAWVAERKDVLSAFFWTSAMWAYAGYARQPSFRRYLGVAVLFVLGLLAKPMVVTLPAALLLLDVWPLGRTPLTSSVGAPLPKRSYRALLVEKLPLFALSAIASAVTFQAQRGSGAMATLEALPIAIRVENAVVAYATYLWKTLSPAGLAVFYPYRNPLPLSEVLLSAGALLAISVLALRTFARHPYFLVGWLWYLGTLVPVIGLIRVGEQSSADRFTYLPHIGIFMAVAWGVPALVADRPRVRKWLAPLAIAIVVGCVLATRVQLDHWRNSATLFERALAVTERNHVAETNLAMALLEQDRVDEALEHARAAIGIRPRDPKVHVNLGAALVRKGEADDARAAYDRALAIDPANSMAHFDLALLLSEQGRWEESLQQYGEVLRIDPNYAKAHSGLGWVLARLGRTEEATSSFRAAIAIDPRLAPAWNGLALVLEKRGRHDEALEVWREALRVDPDDFRLRFNLASALGEHGRMDEAEGEYREILRRRPDLVDARVALAEVFAKRGLVGDATAELRTARADAQAAGRADLASAIDGRLETLASGVETPAAAPRSSTAGP
jgi:protein O-mannosyl-transferase